MHMVDWIDVVTGSGFSGLDVSCSVACFASVVLSYLYSGT